MLNKLSFYNNNKLNDISTYNVFEFYSDTVTLEDNRYGDNTEWDGLTDWGDGIINSELSHTYSEKNKYTVKTKYGIDTSSKGNLTNVININRNITSMSHMFDGCNKLTELDLSNVDVSKVTNLEYLFNNCNELVYLNISDWDTSNVTSISNMFSNCNKLSTIVGIETISVDNVKNMSNTFSNCTSLSSLDLSGWNTGNVTDMSGMFEGCSSLVSVEVSDWNTGNVTNINNIFKECNSLISIDINNWDTGKLQYFDSIVEKCGSITEITLTDLNLSNIVNNPDPIKFFDRCKSLSLIDLNNFDFPVEIYITKPTILKINGNCDKLKNYLLLNLNGNISNIEGCSLYTDDAKFAKMFKKKYTNWTIYTKDEWNIFEVDTSITPDNRVVVLQNDRRGDSTEYDGATDWGDGVINTELSHEYEVDGVYTIQTKYSINKPLTRENDENTVKKIINIVNIDKNMTNMSFMFKNCTSSTS